MIVSMTGYGEVHRLVDGVELSLEMRSVNNRYFKANIKLPESMQFAESDLEKVVRSRISRGSVTVNARLRNATASAAYDVNGAALSRYVESLTVVDLPEGVRATIDLATLSQMPGVCQAPEVSESERATRADCLREMADECLVQLVTMRQREGRALHDDLLQHCQSLLDVLGEVVDRAPYVVDEYREKLTSRVEALIADGKFGLEADSLSREVAIYADRCDISEEVARLRGHIEHFREICDLPTAAGRKLDFLAQEMLREANTIGSKSNDGRISRAVVEMKAVIDRIKEQVQNAE
jgi:uncharacterized protein (TIGR00255 family)